MTSFSNTFAFFALFPSPEGSSEELIPTVEAAIFLLSMRPDSKLEIVLNLLVLILAYLQLTTLFILSVFILNFKVFQFGYRKTKYIKTSASSAESIAWAKQEF